MDRRSRKPDLARPRASVRKRRRKNGHVVQFLLVLSVLALLLGSLIAWRVYNNDRSWREWSMGMRSGLLGMHSSRSSDEASGEDGEGKGEGKGNGEEDGDELAGKSVRYFGGGYAELGEFSVRRYDSITNTTFTVNFHLKAMTPHEDEASFRKFMGENERAFRDRVSEAVRDCRPGDYADTKTMSKKISTRVNRAFGQRCLESAELADFEVYESIGAYESQAWETAEQAAVRRQAE